MSSDGKDDVPAILVEPVRAAARKIDALAEARFLEALRSTGSLVAAAAAARPHLRSRKSAKAVFDAYIATHSGFAARVQDALAEVTSKLDAELVERALHGKVVFEKHQVIEDEEGNQKVVVVEQRIEHDNGLLYKLARDLHRRQGSNAHAPEDRQVNLTLRQEAGAVVELDNILDQMDSDSIRKLIAASRAARVKALESGEVIDDAEVVEDGANPLDISPQGN